MCVCVHVCACVCVCVCVHISSLACYMYVTKYMYVTTVLERHKHTYLHMCTHTCTHSPSNTGEYSIERTSESWASTRTTSSMNSRLYTLTKGGGGGGGGQGHLITQDHMDTQSPYQLTCTCIHMQTTAGGVKRTVPQVATPISCSQLVPVWMELHTPHPSCGVSNCTGIPCREKGEEMAGGARTGTSFELPGTLLPSFRQLRSSLV